MIKKAVGNDPPGRVIMTWRLLSLQLIYEDGIFEEICNNGVGKLTMLSSANDLSMPRIQPYRPAPKGVRRQHLLRDSH